MTTHIVSAHDTFIGICGSPTENGNHALARDFYIHVMLETRTKERTICQRCYDFVEAKALADDEVPVPVEELRYALVDRYSKPLCGHPHRTEREARECKSVNRKKARKASVGISSEGKHWHVLPARRSK